MTNVLRSRGVRGISFGGLWRHPEFVINASVRFLVWGTIPIGALMGGALGEVLGLWPTIVAMAACGLLAPLWVLFSPVRMLRTPPVPV